MRSGQIEEERGRGACHGARPWESTVGGEEKRSLGRANRGHGGGGMEGECFSLQSLNARAPRLLSNYPTQPTHFKMGKLEYKASWGSGQERDPFNNRGRISSRVFDCQLQHSFSFHSLMPGNCLNRVILQGYPWEKSAAAQLLPFLEARVTCFTPWVS